MAWVFVRAVKRGVQVVVMVGDGVETACYTYSYPMCAGQTAAQFKSVVKKEIVAHLAALNSAESEQDVTEEYRP